MNKPKQKAKSKTLLIDGLYNYLQANGNDQLQLRPEELKTKEEKKKQQQNEFSLKMRETDFEQYKKDYSSKIDKQMFIIAQNIANSLFALNNEKFTAFMSRYDVWGFDLTMQQFIIDFYLVVKTDNMLRQFVLMHLDKIILTTRNMIEKYLIMHMGDFSFKETRTEFNKKKLIKQMAENQQQIEQKLKKIDKEPTNKSNMTDITQTSETNNISQIDVTPIQQRNNSSTSQNEIPKILSINQIMNMSDTEKAAIGNENAIPPIQDNLSGIQFQSEQETTPPPPLPPMVPEEEENNEQNNGERQMEQQILANLRREHPELQRGGTANG